MPATVGGLVPILRQHVGREGDAIVCVEFVRSSSQQGVVSAFTFGKGCGRIEGVLETLGVKWWEVVPLVWMKGMGVASPPRPKGSPKQRRDKTLSFDQAQSLFPREPMPHWKAEALLIAEYCRRTYTGFIKGGAA